MTEQKRNKQKTSRLESNPLEACRRTEIRSIFSLDEKTGKKEGVWIKKKKQKNTSPLEGVKPVRR